MVESATNVKTNCAIALDNYLITLLSEKDLSILPESEQKTPNLLDAENQYSVYCKPLENTIDHHNLLEYNYNVLNTMIDELHPYMTKLQQLNQYKNKTEREGKKFNETYDMKQIYTERQNDEKRSVLERNVSQILEKNLYPEFSSDSIMYKKLSKARDILLNTNKKFQYYAFKNEPVTLMQYQKKK